MMESFPFLITAWAFGMLYECVRKMETYKINIGSHNQEWKSYQITDFLSTQYHILKTQLAPNHTLMGVSTSGINSTNNVSLVKFSPLVANMEIMLSVCVCNWYWEVLTEERKKEIIPRHLIYLILFKKYRIFLTLAHLWWANLCTESL